MRKFQFLLLLSALIPSLVPNVSYAADIPFAVRQAVVWVHCGNRQGSGVVINGDKGYVLTNAHVAMDVEHGATTPDPCEVGFVTDGSYEPKVFYTATAEKYIFDEATNQDFAILDIQQPEQPTRFSSFPFLKTDEFSQVNDPLSVVSYPHTAGGAQLITSGTIQSLSQGTIHTDAVLSPGSSGGPALNAHNDVIGFAMGILIETLKTGEERVVDYELVDIRAVLTWLDTYGVNVNDQYVTHSDPARYHGPAQYITPTNLNCITLVRTTLSTTVYCLKADSTRSVFPNTSTFQSWLANFSTVQTVLPDAIAGYRLTSNVTFKPGSIIKIQTDPKVYLVTDAQGTIRWIPSEDRARELFGDGWAGFVKDVPVEFFQNYHVTDPLP